MVQKILTTVAPGFNVPDGAGSLPPPRLGEDNIVVWTGDGRLGQVSFGAKEGFDEAWVDGVVEGYDDGDSEEGKRRAFGAEMRRALEMQAREVRWLRGYGL